MRKVVLALMLLTASAVAAAPAPFAKADRRTDLERIRGEWVVASEEVSVTINIGRGNVAGRAMLDPAGRAVVITGDRLGWFFGGKLTSAEVIRLDKGAIDVTDTLSRETRRGIYRVEGDTLTVCTSPAGKADRPASFKADREGESVFVLRRKR